MSRRVSPVNLLVDSLLPPALRDGGRVYDKKGVSTLLTEVARTNPEAYAPLAKALGDIGRNQAWFRGETFRLSDFRPPVDRAPYWAELDEAENRIWKSELSGKERNSALAELYADVSARLQKETNVAALAKKNSVAVSVLTGARGKEPQLRDLLSSPGFYPDARGNIVPGFVRRSYAEGVRPADYMAGMYSSRSAIVESKRAVAQGGALAKVLSRASLTTLVTQPDCGTSNGIDLTAGEPDIRGRVLQRLTAGIPAGTVITRDVYAKLKAAKPPVVLVRSPMTCESKDGICAKCFGVKAEGRFPAVGDHVGVTAATSVGEPLAQGGLNMKHVTSGKGVAKEYSGLDTINRFVESPEEFEDRAVVAKLSGVVREKREAPQGGWYLKVGETEHYVRPDRSVTVQPGQSVEEGEQLTDGLADPEDILNHRGLGSARAYWAEKLSQIAKASGAGGDRRNFETLARAAIDHVDLDDPVEEGFLPDDRLRFSAYNHMRELPADTRRTATHKAVGGWLQQPALHYTPGTKLTQKMADRLGRAGFGEVFVSDSEPTFRPVLVRLQQVGTTTDDWLASLGGSYLKAQLGEGVLRAQDTNIEENVHPVPRLAYGVGYGDRVGETGKF